MDSMMNAMGFKRVVDYEKPIGWHCVTCALDPAMLGGNLWTKDCSNPTMLANAAQVTCTCGTVCIPVYAVIPEGERPQTTWGETGGDDAVCFGDGFGDPEFIIGFEAHLPYGRIKGRRCAFTFGDEWARWGALSSADKRDDPNDLASAIRHVAEE